MDEHRFDHLARQLGSNADRRTILKRLVGGLAATFALGVGGARATAKTCSTNADCGTDGKCTYGTCVADGGEDGGDGGDGGGQTCIFCRRECERRCRFTGRRGRRCRRRCRGQCQSQCPTT